MEHLIRTRFAKDIIAEVAIPETQTGKIVILLTGLPSSPSKPKIIEYWKKLGYVVILPRYRGTWESDGEFLKKSPEKDVIDISTELSKKYRGIYNPYTQNFIKIQVSKIFVVGASFGGTAAILSSKSPFITKVVALSPVIDWQADSEVEPFTFLYQYTAYAFGNAYRAPKENWDKLLSGKFYSPKYENNKLPAEKICIIHTKDDSIVPIEPLYLFVEKTNCALEVHKKGGHLSISDSIKSKYNKKITNFLT